MFHPLITTLLFLLFFTSSSFSATETIDIDLLSLEAKKENKHLLVFFHKYGCVFCEKMIESTLADESIEEIIDKYFMLVDIGIDDEGGIIHRDFNGSKHGYAKSLEIGFYPTVGFVDGNNTIVYGVIGYRDSDIFSLVLQYVY
ncbi:MAG: thioredoxin fold domain-containing protein, partial [Sulfurovum sp.]|nr:thioredoxin fold domain-containing protein [Sulfurovum sp.]